MEKEGFYLKFQLKEKYIELFKLLKPEEFGIQLSETFQIHPEQSTSALVVYHPNATYYNV